MHASLHALLEHLVDYAGLFPPAELDMATTVGNYGRYLGGDDSWMLGRLIVPVARLDEFEQAAGGLLPRDESSDPWHLSGLTAPAGSETLGAHLERIAVFNRTHATPSSGAAVIDVIELKGVDPGAIDDALDRIPDEVYPFFELAVDHDPRGSVAALVGSDAGAKVRTGGVTADLHPSPFELARFIQSCAAAGVPFKATAGLHHPLRHHAESVGAEQFGFLNVFLAASIAAYAEHDTDLLEAVLTEGSPAAFEVEPDAITWREHRLETDQIEDTRLAFAVSFGSCSFDEPREDLRGLGWM